MLGLLLLCPASARAQESVASRNSDGRTGAPLSALEMNVTRLNRVISLDLKNVPLGQALQTISAQGNLQVVYGSQMVAKEGKVSVRRDRITVLEALHEVLRGTELSLKITPSGHLLVVRADEAAPAAEMAAHQVRGRVIAAEDQQPLPGVNVVVKGTTTGTTTDIDGNYQLTVPSPNDSLVFSYVGYHDQTVGIAGRAVVNVELQPATEELGDVVVIGYGEKSRQLLTESIGTVSSDQIQQLPVASPDQALQGRISGVQVTSVDGTPGSPVAIRIRGVGTVGNTQPLFVIDGVPVGNSAGANTNPLATINPTDIESISVLKDASAAAVYGVRAANGVVIITTKRGQWGAPKVTFDAYYGVQRLPQMWDMLSSQQWFDITKEAYNAYNTQMGLAPTDGSYQKLHPDLVAPGTTDQPSALLGIDNSKAWVDAAENNNAPIQQYNTSISGASERLNYFISAGYFSQQAVVQRWDLSRYNFRANGDYQITKRLKLGQTFSLSYQKTNRGMNSGGDGFLLPNSAEMPPFFNIYDVDNSIAGNRYGYSGNRRANGQEIAGITRGNQVGINQIVDRNDRTTRMIGGLNAEFEILKGLKYRSAFSMDYSTSRNDSWSPGWTAAEMGYGREANNYEDSRNEGTGKVFTNTLNYDGKVGDHTLNVLAGVEYQHSEGVGLAGYAENFISTDPNFYKVVYRGQKSTWTLRGGAGESANLGYIGRVSYDYKNRYLLTGTVRRDGSSNFSPEDNRRWGTFPSVSAAWRISEEPFFQNVPGISTLKLRGSWGQLGNANTAAFPHVFRVSTSPDYGLGQPNQTIPAPSPINFVNKDVTWETVETVDFGFDVSLFQDKVDLLATYYRRKTKDFLIPLPIPHITGFGSTSVNAGSVMNKGIELELGYHNNFFDNQLQFDATANLTTVDNELTELAPGIQEFLSNEIYRTAIGNPIGYFYGYQTAGLYQTPDEAAAALPDNTIGYAGNGGTKQPQPGDIIFVDNNGPAADDAPKGTLFSGKPDGKIDFRDRTYLGKTIPDAFYGLNFNARYKAFDVSLFFQGLAGVQLYNQFRRYHEGLGGGGLNQLSTVMDRWHGPGTSNSMPRAVQNDPNGNGRFSDRWVEDGDYFRLKNLQIGFTIPQSLAKTMVQSARVYISATNLLTITGYSGLDPEVMSYGSNGSQIGLDVTSNNNYYGGAGTDIGNIPQPRIIQVGVQLQF